MELLFNILSFGGLALAIICLGVAIFLFIFWNIPKVLGDITGATQKKTIKRIQQEGYETNANKKSSIKTSDETGQIRIRQSETGELGAKGTTGQIRRGNTGQMRQGTTGQMRRAASGKIRGTDDGVTNTVFQVYKQDGTSTKLVTPNPDETTALAGIDPNGADNTTVLGVNDDLQTSVLNTASNQVAATDDGPETSVLSNQGDEPETSVLATNTESEPETSVLTAAPQSEAETSVLAQGPAESETSVLTSGPDFGKKGQEESDDIVVGTAPDNNTETTVLTAGSKEAETSVLNGTASKGGNVMHESEAATSILSTNSVEGVINLPVETFTQPGSYAKVLDFVVTHTDDVIS